MSDNGFTVKDDDAVLGRKIEHDGRLTNKNSDTILFCYAI